MGTMKSLENTNSARKEPSNYNGFPKPTLAELKRIGGNGRLQTRKSLSCESKKGGGGGKPRKTEVSVMVQLLKFQV